MNATKAKKVFEENLTFGCVVQVDDRSTGGRFATTGLTNQTERFTALDGEGNTESKNL
jgi:hypothetical protein